MKQSLQFVLLVYKRWLSPMLPHSCRFVPTCSEYAMEAIECHGAARGTGLALKRLLRCQPFARAGLDSVPQREQTFSPAPQDRVRQAGASMKKLDLVDGN